MKNKEIKRNKDTGNIFQKYCKSFKHSVDGIVYVIENEFNILIMMLVTILVLALCFFLKISQTELCLIVICTGLLMACELINSAIEAAVDLTTLEINPLAKISKDCSSGGTFIAAFAYATVVCIIVVPKIIDLF